MNSQRFASQPHPTNPRHRPRLTGLFLACGLGLTQAMALANGIYRNGAGAWAMSLGGADVAWAQAPLAALAANPAALASLRRPALEASLTGAVASGAFRNSVNREGGLDRPYGLVPEAALALPLDSPSMTLALGLIPDALLSADWRYVDAPGGLNGQTTYGDQQHHAEIAVMRSAAGVGFALGPKWSFGASVGLVYNYNTLETPYIFQTEPVLRGFKTLLDLQTDGFGYNGSVGALFRPGENLQLGFSYTTKTTVHTHGDASGNAAAQLQSLGGAFSAVRPDFHYDAEVINAFPQVVSAGLSWNISSRWRLALQADWINWSDAFDRLEIKLRGGDNADLNALVGSDSTEDLVPLAWKDRFVYRVGVEFGASARVRLRAGYAYGQSPVPEETLTPLTAAILEHTLSAGLGVELGRCQLNLGYQFDLPSARQVTASVIRAGEYRDSRVAAGIHWIGVSTMVRF